MKLQKQLQADKLIAREVIVDKPNNANDDRAASDERARSRSRSEAENDAAARIRKREEVKRVLTDIDAREHAGALTTEAASIERLRVWKSTPEDR